MTVSVLGTVIMLMTQFVTVSVKLLQAVPMSRIQLICSTDVDSTVHMLMAVTLGNQCDYCDTAVDNCHVYSIICSSLEL